MSGVVQGLIASLVSAAGAVTDTFFRYVSLLLNTTSTNGAQNNTFLDGSTNAFSITRNGNTTQGTFSPFSQTGWSNYFDGSGDTLSIASNTAFDLGSSNFTIEGWIYQTSGTLGCIVNRRPAAIATGWLFAAGEFSAYINGAWRQSVITATVTNNVWLHVALVRNGNVFTLYHNGSSVGTYTQSGAVQDLTQNIVIGAAGGTTEILTTGYISNVRIVAGTAVYTANFTPPTSPLTAISGTSLLTCQSNRFIDNSSNAFTITRNGDVSVQAFSPFAPTAAWSASTNGGSGYFDGAGDYLIAPTNAAFDFGSGNFTVEMWFYTLIANSNYQRIFTINASSGTANESIIFEIDINGIILAALNSSTSYGATTSTALRPNTWNHLALVRNGNTVTGYINGASAGSSTMTVPVNFATGAFPQIGAWQQSGSYSRFINGYVADLRIVKGTAVYTANFTPPTAPLTAITNTSLLLNFTNAGIYDSASSNDLETVGNAQVSTTQAKWGTTSMVFDGTGDWLVQIDRPALRLGTAAFTIEMWVYRSASGTYGLISKGTSTTGWSVSLNASNQVVFSFAASSFNSTGTVAATTWTHIAVVREGTGASQTKIYINGTNDGTGTVATDFSGTDVMYVGADRVAGSNFNGYIDDLRITNGVARYTSNFTAPTAAFPLQ